MYASEVTTSRAFRAFEAEQTGVISSSIVSPSSHAFVDADTSLLSQIDAGFMVF